MLDELALTQAASLDVSSTLSFCARPAGVERAAFSLKQSSCPHCGCVGSLNRHSHARGNDPAVADGQTIRGQRVFCSNRGQRGGCGRTFLLCLAEVLPRHTLTASLVWPWLVKLLAGLSLKAAVEKAAAALCLGSTLPVAAQIMPAAGPPSHPALPRAKATGQRAG